MMQLYTENNSKQGTVWKKAMVLLAGLTFLSCSPDKIMAETKAYSYNQNSKGVAIFAGGCFWCMEQPLESVPGIKAVYSGYCGGKERSPAYKQVASGMTSHVESVLVEFDETKITYEQLLQHFWQNINPVQRNGQFYDIGPHYRTVIFYINQEQKEIAEKSKAALQKSGKFNKPIATEILPATEFWLAEDYHQDYYKKEPEAYYRYKNGSGRAQYLKETWGKN